MRRASAPRSIATAAGSSAARRSPAASSTRCSPTRSSSAASATRATCIPVSMPRSSTRTSGRRCRSGSPATTERPGCATSAKSPSPLAGRLFDPDGQKMRPSHATKKGRRYRYYVSAGLIEGSVATGARGWRIPAAEIEAVIAIAIAARVREPTLPERAAWDWRSRPIGSETSCRRVGEDRTAARRSHRPDRSPAAGGDRSARERDRDRGAGRCSICRAQATSARCGAADADLLAGHRLHRGRADTDGPARTGAAIDPARRSRSGPTPRSASRSQRSSPRGFVSPTTSHPAAALSVSDLAERDGIRRRRRLALAAARLPGARSRRAHPRRHSTCRTDRRAAEADWRASPALVRTARTPHLTTPPCAITALRIILEAHRDGKA